MRAEFRRNDSTENESPSLLLRKKSSIDNNSHKNQNLNIKINKLDLEENY
jgi:hypothetical protein